MAMVAEGEIHGDEVGFLGDKSADDGPKDPEKEHQHLRLRNGYRCRSKLGLAQGSESKGRTRLLVGTA